LLAPPDYGLNLAAFRAIITHLARDHLVGNWGHDVDRDTPVRLPPTFAVITTNPLELFMVGKN
jgi:hypothetical protein